MRKSKKKSAFDLSLQNESLDDLIQPKYIIRNFYSSPLLKSRFTENDLYARDEREYRRMLRKANKKPSENTPVFGFDNIFTSPTPSDHIVFLENGWSYQAEDLNDLLEKAKNVYEAQNEKTDKQVNPAGPVIDVFKENTYSEPEETISKISKPDNNAFEPVKPQPEIMQSLHKNEQNDVPQPSLKDKPVSPSLKQEANDDVIKIPKDPFFPEPQISLGNPEMKSRISIKYDAGKGEKPSRLKRQQSASENAYKGIKSRLSRLKIKDKTTNDKEAELKRIAQLINQDGYYDNRIPVDYGTETKKVRKGFFIKLGLLTGALIAVLTGFIYYLIYWL